MSVLTGSLEFSSLIGGSDRAAGGYVLSPGTLEAIHEDGVRLARGRMLLTLALIGIISAATAVAVFTIGRLLQA